MTLKVLGQVNPAAATETTLYTVPAATATVVSSLMVCNTGAAATFRVVVAPAGIATAAKHHLYYEVTLEAGETFAATLGISLATTDVIRVQASTTGLAFSLFGLEESTA